uniref:Uncharacterized protein n=1 Tax=Anguilla anguilla TaxID=7936 RepID=A0A0E9TD70_ANGAN
MQMYSNCSGLSSIYLFIIITNVYPSIKRASPSFDQVFTSQDFLYEYISLRALP